MMSRTGGKLLFVGHDASRTGAPLILLHFLRWCREHLDADFELLLRSGGDLVPEYRAVAPTRVLFPPRSSVRWLRRLQALRDRVVRGPALARALRRHYPARRFPLVYANTVANGELVRIFGEADHRVVCHAHEMRYGIERWGGATGRDSAQHVQTFIAASNAVKRALIEAWGIDEGRLHVVHEFGQPPSFGDSEMAHHRERFRQRLRVGPHDIVVGMCGVADWRKGADLFLQVARHTVAAESSTRFHFVWIGGADSPLEAAQFEHDRRHLGVEPHVTLTGRVADGPACLAGVDVFCLTSREDPFPLVMLEAAALGIPIVCFDRSGGTPEFVANDAGLVVPYADTAAMAGAVRHLGLFPESRRALGRVAQERARRDHSLASQAPKLAAVIERHLG